MSDAERPALPCVVFFNINGSGMGHLSTCLAYANRLRGRARPVFFSLASAIEIIEEMRFEADYLVSPFWSRASTSSWNRQLAIRLGMLFERVHPRAVVFDGTWPFQGLLDAASAFGVPRLVWSNLTLYRPGVRTVPISESRFDLLIKLGEIGSRYTLVRQETPARTVLVPPVALLGDEELLTREDARDALGLKRDGRYALFSLGPGNLKDVSGIARGLADAVAGYGYQVVWAKPPISQRDIPFADDVLQVSVYPLVKYMRAFDIFAGAAGYNTCCEVVQASLPSILVPNDKVVDDQTRRARMVAEHAPVVVSPCETSAQQAEAVGRLMELANKAQRKSGVDLSGAERVADEIMRLIECGPSR